MGLAEFLYAFYRADKEDRNAMIADEPVLFDVNLGDVYLAATTDYLTDHYNLRRPEWTFKECRFLHRPHFATGLESLKAMLLMESPTPFRMRMIFVEAKPLRRASQHAR